MTKARIRWTQSETQQVALRTMELMQRGYTKGAAMALAQEQCLEPDRRRSQSNKSYLGETFASELLNIETLTEARVRAFAHANGFTLLDDLDKAATTELNLQEPPVQEVAPVEPEPAQTPEPEAVVAAPVEEAKPFQPIVATVPVQVLAVAEKNLLAAVHDYLAILIKPMVDSVVKQVHNNYVIPQLEARLTKSVEGALTNAIQANAKRIQDHVQSQVQSAIPKTVVAPPVEVVQKAAPPTAVAPLRLNDYWNPETDNIIVLGMWPAIQETLKNAIRNTPWFNTLRLYFVQELSELEQKRNEYTHLIQLEKFSAHLPKGFRNGVKRIYPDVRGMTRAREVIEAIVLGNRTVASY